MTTPLAKVRVYFGKLFQINISRDFGRNLEEQRWENGAEAYSVVDPKTGDIIITRDLMRAAQFLVVPSKLKAPRGLPVPKELPGVSTPKKPHLDTGQDGVCPRFKIPILHDGGPDEEPELPRRWS